MAFRWVFTAIVIATALIVTGFLINQQRPPAEVMQPTAALVRAAGKCAECHRHETEAVVHEYELSAHAAANVNCLECHAPQEGQEALDHRGFVIAAEMTALNCAQCHRTEYQQYLRSRHAAPAWAAVSGPADFTPEQVRFAEGFHPGAVDRPPNDLVAIEGPAAVTAGCSACHDVGKPNLDGSIGTCTACHSRHNASITLARTPETCGQCHMGPDHSQIEIYHESKHGVLFNAQKDLLNLEADPKSLSVRDMFVPTCATCHMSGLDGLKVTHDTTERLSYWLFAPISEKRPHYARAQAEMKETCLKCHTERPIEQYYQEAEAVLVATNERVREAMDLMKALRDEGLLTPEPFDEEIEFVYFDLWHYYGRTAKHGAFMGGADFVQWHGNYELVHKMTVMKQLAEELRASHEPRAQAE